MNQKADSYTERVSTSNPLSKRLKNTDVKQICFETDRMNAQPPSLIFKQKSGVQDSLKYMQLMGERYMPNKGIILFYSQATVTITGVQLKLLFKELTQQKVALISVYSFATDMLENEKLEKDVAIVKSITVNYHDATIEKHIATLENESFTRNGHANDEKSEGF